MRIGTWNLNYAPAGKRDAIRQVLAQQNADIWILTETRTDVFDTLEVSGFTGIHSNAPPVERVSDEQDRWTSIWSRYPVLKQISTNDQKRTVCAMLDLKGRGKLIVYGTVLPWPAEGNAKWDEVVPAQAKEWRAIAEQHGVPLIVAGDFNASFRGEKSLARSGAKALEQSLAEWGMSIPTAGLSIAERPLIDHIAMPKSYALGVRECALWAVDEKRLSDHSGVVLDFDGL